MPEGDDVYLRDDGIVFCSLAIGEVARQKVRLLCESIIKFTHHLAVIVTDDITAFGDEYNYRIKFIHIDECKTSLTLKGATGQFQYNLKLIPIREVYNLYNSPVIIYCDSDVFLFGYDRTFERWFTDKPECLFARMRGPISETKSDPVLLKKVVDMGYDPLTIHTPVPIEAVMWFKTGNKLNDLLNTWESIAAQSYVDGVRSDYESVDMSIAMHKIGYNYVALDSTYPSTDNFRLLHYEKIIQLFV